MPQAAAQDQWEDVTPRIASGISPSNKNSASGQLTPGNVDLAKQPRVKNADGSVSTVDSHSYGVDGKEVLLPSVTADGRHLMKDEDILAEYKKTGRHLGMFDTPENATAYAKQLHNDYAAGKYGGADEWEDVVPQQKPPAQAGAPAKPGFFRTMAQDIGSMVKPLVGAGGVQIEDPEQFRKKYEAMTPEQQTAQRAETRSNVRAMPTSDINNQERTNYAERRNAGQSPVRAVAETSYEAGAGANMTGFDEAARQGNTAEALGHLAAPVTLGAATHGLTKIPEAPEAIRSATHEIRDSVGKLVRTDTGELKPLVHAASRVGGGIVGGGIGAATGIPYAGYGGLALGGAVGPEVADAILPNRPAPLGVAPTEPSAGEFYENRAQDLTRRGKEQASLDRTAARNAPKTTDPTAERNAAYEQKARDLMTRQKEQDVIDHKAAEDRTRLEKEAQKAADDAEAARNQHGQDLMDRQKEQDKLDADAARADNAAARQRRDALKARDKTGQDLMDRQAQQDKLDREAAQTRKKAEDARNQLAQDRVDRQAQQDALDAKHAKALKDLEEARQKELSDRGRLNEQDAAARNRRGETKQEPGTAQTAAPLGPNGNTPPQPAPPTQPVTLGSNGSNPQDLISRTRKVIIPGDEPSTEDLKRAGDFTQAPLEKLKTLAKFGDKLAQNELNRRLKNE